MKTLKVILVLVALAAAGNAFAHEDKPIGDGTLPTGHGRTGRNQIVVVAE